MTIKLNSFSDRLLTSVSFMSFSDILSWSFIRNIFLCLLVLPDSGFSVLGKSSISHICQGELCVDFMWIPQKQFLQTTRARCCSRVVPCVGCACPSTVAGLYLQYSDGGAGACCRYVSASVAYRWVVLMPGLVLAGGCTVGVGKFLM